MVIQYIKKNYLILLFGAFILGIFGYLTFAGNQICDCEKTEKYRDGAARNHRSGTSHGYYRYYHK